jgi:hypothetical protein
MRTGRTPLVRPLAPQTATSVTRNATPLVKCKTAYPDKLIGKQACCICNNAAILQGEEGPSMPAQHTQHGQPSFIARMQQPLIAIPSEKDGEEEVRYFVSEEAANAAYPDSVQEAVRVAGAWDDLDWEETVQALDRIRHASNPTPPLSL